jgi:type IV pilus assembly protein PilC
MAEFVCKVGDPAGRVFQQIETAQSEAEAKQKLADRGYFVYSIKAHFGLLSSLGRSRGDRAVRGADFLIFNQQFNTLIKAGLPILKALDLLSERTAAPSLRPLLMDVRQRVREGAPLSDAFEAAGVFPKVYTTALLAGERSGNLAGVLDDYIAYQRVTSGVRKKVIGVLIYPAILVVVGSSILTYLFTAVIPQFAKLYTDLGVKLPGPTQLLTTIVVGYRMYILAGFLGSIAGIILLYLWSRTETGGLKLDRLKMKTPFIGDTWLKFHVAQFVRTLATLLAGGTPLVTALQTSSEALGARLLSAAVRQAAARVREGEALNVALASTGMMPSLALEMIEVGEASGALAPMLNSVAVFYEEDTAIRTNALITVIEPAILVFMALIVAFVLISLYLPLFSINVGSS